jgi:hypothetical protein
LSETASPAAHGIAKRQTKDEAEGQSQRWRCPWGEGKQKPHNKNDFREQGP